MLRWIELISVPMLFVFLYNYKLAYDNKDRGNGSSYIRVKGARKTAYIYWGIAVAFLILFAGLRIRYNDTTTYLGNFENELLTPEIHVYLRDVPFRIDNYWGYGFLKSLLRTLGMDAHLMLLCFTAMYVSIHVWFMRKYAGKHLSMTMLVFLADGYLMLLAALKQVCAIAFALIAIDALINNKTIRYLLWMFIAITFHPYVFVLFLVIFVKNKKPWSVSTWGAIVLMVVMGVGMTFTAEVLERFNDTYNAEYILSNTVHPMRFIVSLVPVIISFHFRKILYEDSTTAENLFAYLSLFRCLFYFWALFGNPIVFARVANFFDLSNAIFLGWSIDKIQNNRKTQYEGSLLKIGLYMGFLLFSFYSCVMGFQFVRQTEHISIYQLAASIRRWLGGL